MKKLIIRILGYILLALGGIGLFFPVWPTTPFVLLAAACFSYSSKKTYALLCKNRFFGPYIENHRTRQGVPLRLKKQSIFFLWLLLGLSALAMGKLWILPLFLLIGSAVTVHILLLKTKESGVDCETTAPARTE